MDDFGTLARDLGFRQGKSAPMAPSKANIAVGSDGGDRRTRSSSSFSDDHNRDGLLFSDVFGGGPKFTATTTNNDKSSKTTMPDFDYDSIFKTSSSANDSKPKPPSVSVYDKPVYDDDVDIFDGLPGLKSKSTSASVSYDENAFSSFYSPPKQRDQFDDLLGNLGRTEKAESKRNKSSSSNSRGLDDLIPGFGGSSPTGNNRPISESSQPQKSTVNLNNTTSSAMENPFVDIGSTSVPVNSSKGLFNDPLEEISKLGNAGSTKVDGSYSSGGLFDDIDPLNGFGKSVPSFSDTNGTQTSASKEAVGKHPFKNSESYPQKKIPVDKFQDSDKTPFEMPADFHKPVGQSQTTSSPSFLYTNPDESTSRVDISPRSEEDVENSDDVWLTVSDIPLFTPPTSAPPPSRPPPPVPARASKAEKGSFISSARRKGDEFSASQSSSQYSQSPKIVRPTPKNPMTSQIDELEDFATGRTWVDEHAEVHSSDEVNTNSAAAASAAAMKEAMDRAEAKFRHAKEVREREYAKAGRNKDAVQLEKDEQAMQDVQEREFRENQERLERDRRQREREEEERVQRRLEKEREKVREMEKERELGRQAVERATREARERAAAEARGRAATETRLKSERAAVDKANAEARGRAERVAVQRAQSEARERAAAEARERAEKAASEARERANAEAREKESREKAAVARAEAEARRRAERAAVERAAAEARERAAAAARERAASASRMSQQRNDDDFESFFSTVSRPSSVPRPRGNSSDPVVDPQVQSRGGPEASRRTSVGASSDMRKVSSTTNIVDDLSSIFGAAAPSAGEFREVEGESEERRRARLERQQRTHERATKALAEKNQRDLQTQRDQEERHRFADSLDIEIKRWSAGKEGNLRALLSTMQYVLWPECGWQPVSLTDLITGASVKKVYRKATLCIHPDKVQQKGANLQQKYIAEKVFDLLKEAWNKFNSEELF